MKIIFVICALLIALPALLGGCVPGDGSYTDANPAGFLWGIWHGFIVWVTFFMGLFTGGAYNIYESVNTGWTYNLGFLIGAGSALGGSIGGVQFGRRGKHD